MRRDGTLRTLPADRLVPGDVVVLQAGDRVPADVRLIEAVRLLIDESALTGESLPAAKDTEAVAQDTPLADRSPMAYSGTTVMAGQGVGAVVATGAATEVGRIGALVGSVRRVTTPLLARIDRFGRRITLATLALAAAVFAVFTGIHDQPWDAALLVVVALAVGMVPEELPAVITIALAVGVRRMAAHRAVVRALPAVETLGSTTVICTDKTGTLTRNEMTLRQVVTASGSFPPAGGRPPAAPEARDLARAAILCSDARPGAGDPTEIALLPLADWTGETVDGLRRRWRRTDVLPFDSATKLMAVEADDGGGPRVFVKGAPERLLALCAREARREGPAPLDRAAWEARIAEAARAGERVLGFAEGPACGPLAQDSMGRGLVLLGFVGLSDPPRAEVPAAIAECRAAGVRIAMITGDHADTAAAIARELGLGDSGRVVTGAEIDALSDSELPALAQGAAIFARTTSEHKLRLVRALQSSGEVVAMTGDGVNDSPALKQADVGVAMGRKGTEAARQAAQIVLTDDNFATIVAAIREGRTVFDNVRKVVTWVLPTNVGEALIVVLAATFGLTVPMTATQILWINMIPTVTLGLVLAWEPPEDGVMRRPPVPPGTPLLDRFLVWRICFVSLLFLAGGFGLFFWAVGHGHGVEVARTLVVDALVLFEVLYLMIIRTSPTSARRTAPGRIVWGAIAAAILGQVLFTYLAPLNAIFDSRPLTAGPLGVLALAGAVFLAAMQAERLIIGHLERRGRPCATASGTPDGR